MKVLLSFPQKARRNKLNPQVVIESAKDIMYSIDSELRYIHFNEVLKSVVYAAYQVEPMPGSRAYPFTLPLETKEKNEWHTYYKEAFKGRKISVVREVPYDGKTSFWSFTFNPVFKNSRVTEVRCSAHNVTALYKAYVEYEQLKGKFKLIFDSNPLPYCIYSSQTLRFLDVNNAAIKHYGYTKHEFLRMTVNELNADGQENDIKERDVSDYKAISRHKKKNGDVIDVEISAHPIALGGDHSMLAVIHDITDLKKAEEHLKTTEELLEEKILLRTEQLKQANKELESYSYTVSHDLRGPLRHINGFSKILLRKKYEQLDEEGREYLNNINEGIAKMEELISHLLHFSRIKEAQLENKLVDFNEMVKEIVAEAKLFSNYEHTVIRIHQLEPHVCDNAMVRQVWVNLISNALKYSAKKDPALIDIGCRKEGDKTLYYVKDNGAGFDMQYAHQLFKVFKRLHSDDDFEGTGVGLAFVCRIISKHGGKIWADAKQGEGATFYFTLGG